ncbi:MAG: hypothetical protein MJ141_04865 [Clostridia bacterium]|nr:hypothetical protein [Clostridia bacterium]
MKLTYRLNAENFTDYILYLTETPEHRKRVREQGLLAGLLVLVIGAVMIFATKSTEWITTAVASVSGAVIIALLFPAIARGGSRMAVINAIKTEGENMFREQTLRLTEDSIHVESGEEENVASRDFLREEITSADTYKSILLLHFENGNLLIVPLEALNDEQKELLLHLK